MSEGGRHYCENCGARISQTANFCSNCGTARNPALEEPIGPLAEEPTGPLAPTLVQEPAIRVPTPVQAPKIRVNTAGLRNAGVWVFSILSVGLYTLGLELGTAFLVAGALLVVSVAAWLHKNWGNIEFVTTPERRGRPPIPAAVRRLVLLRDGGRCQHCGSYKEPQVDHVVPYSRGGTHAVNNLQILCGPCNRRKGNRYVG